MIRWRIHVRASPSSVYDLIATDAGRARFWAESAVEREGAIDFVFPNGARWRGEVLERVPDRAFAVRYLGGSTSRFALSPDSRGGTDVELTDDGVADHDMTETTAGWVSVLLALKAAADFGSDLRNHDPERTWDEGYCDN